MKVLIKPVVLDVEEEQDVVAYCDNLCYLNFKSCDTNICGANLEDDEVDDILF